MRHEGTSGLVRRLARDRRKGMQEGFEIQHPLDLEDDPKTLRRGFLMGILTGAIVAFVLLCLGYYFAIDNVRPMARLLFS